MASEQPQSSNHPAPLIDNWWERILWGSVVSSERLVGLRIARGIAALLMRRRARTKQGYSEGVVRVAARHVWAKAPELRKLPEHWWQSSPLVRVHRLGLEIDLDLRDNLQRVLYFTGTYEPQVLRLLQRELAAGAVFVDVGAHIGIHSLVAAKHLERLGGGRVYAFEPSPESAGCIRYTAAGNEVEVAVVETALGVAPGSVRLFGDERYHEADLGVRSQFGTGAPAAEAPVVPFDQWAAGVGLDRLDAVKIDVEGAEALVIEGMRESLTRLRPRLLIVEAKDDAWRQSAIDRAALRARIESLGYQRCGAALFGNDVYRPRKSNLGAVVPLRSTTSPTA